MTSHPDADALMGTVLDHLDDRVSRLVFADWLDETGTPSNAAWARYIRLTHADTPPDPGNLARAAVGIRAKLTLHTRFFLNHRRDVLDLLPPTNVRVRLAEFHPPLRVVESVPESVARENQVLLLDCIPPPDPWPNRRPDRLFVFAAANPWPAPDPSIFTDTLQKLAFILNATVQFVGADPEDLRQAIRRVYGESETESVDCVLVEFPDPEPPTPAGRPYLAPDRPRGYTGGMHELFEHTADLGLRVTAPDLNTLFAEAGVCLFSAVVEDVTTIRPDRSVRIEIPGADREYLLIDWLKELLHRSEMDRSLFGAFAVAVRDNGLTATAWGESFDPARHLLSHEVKAITYHGLKVEPTSDGWLAEVIVDI